MLGKEFEEEIQLAWFWDGVGDFLEVKLFMRWTNVGWEGSWVETSFGMVKFVMLR